MFKYDPQDVDDKGRNQSNVRLQPCTTCFNDEDMRMFLSRLVASVEDAVCESLPVLKTLCVNTGSLPVLKTLCVDTCAVIRLLAL